MRRPAIISLLAATLLVTGIATAAEAETTPLPLPTSCQLTSFSSAALGPDTYHGVMYGEPVVAAALPPTAPLANPVSITLTCTLHVWGPTPDPAIETSGSGVAVATAPPVAVTYTATENDQVAVCGTAVLTDANGATYTYYQSDDNGMWGTTPDCDGAKCLALGSNCDYTLALIEWLIDHSATPDSLICPVLASLAPGIPDVIDIDNTGDTYVAGIFVWDCPPYTG